MGMLLMMLAGWINRHQQDVIEYLKEENKILRENPQNSAPENSGNLCVASSRSEPNRRACYGVPGGQMTSAEFASVSICYLRG